MILKISLICELIFFQIINEWTSIKDILQVQGRVVVIIKVPLI